MILFTLLSIVHELAANFFVAAASARAQAVDTTYATHTVQSAVTHIRYQMFQRACFKKIEKLNRQKSFS